MARGRGSPTGIMAKDSSIGGGFLGLVPKGMICLLAMGTRRGRELQTIGGENFDEMAMETGMGSFI